ncbi:unnamed protein product [Toxocara canis]|uniref:CUGBP Elav-like family member 4 n=1 Tax=Toxocara canis TaxID=6265 RepID=A0A183TXU0_TOXCA|nr:unnamed protein product [Toxocara canis]
MNEDVLYFFVKHPFTGVTEPNLAAAAPQAATFQQASLRAAADAMYFYNPLAHAVAAYNLQELRMRIQAQLAMPNVSQQQQQQQQVPFMGPFAAQMILISIFSSLASSSCNHPHRTFCRRRMIQPDLSRNRLVCSSQPRKVSSATLCYAVDSCMLGLPYQCTLT